MALALKDRGCHFLDSPVMGAPFVSRQKKLTILASSDEKIFESVRPLLQSLGQKVLYVGEVGSGMTIKLLLNLHLWVMMASYAECVTIGKKLGISPSKFSEIVNNTVIKNYVSVFKARKIIENDWIPDADMPVAVKDLRLITEVSIENGSPILLGSVARDLFTAAQNNGFKDYDVMAVVLMYSKMAGINLF